MLDRCGQRYVELAGWTAVLEVAEAQTAPISMVGRLVMQCDWAKPFIMPC